MAKQAKKPAGVRGKTTSALRPRWMRLDMWLVYLLRTDVRGGAAPVNKEAQREFVAWWFLWGRREYPAVWCWGPAQAAIAMQLVPLDNGLRCPRLLRRLHSARVDLKRAFPLQDEESLAAYLCWYRVRGPLELDAAPPLPAESLAMTEAPCRRAPCAVGSVSVPRIAIALAHSSAELARSGLGEGQVTAQSIVRWYEVDGQRFLPAPTLPPAPFGKSAREASNRRCKIWWASCAASSDLGKTCEQLPLRSMRLVSPMRFLTCQPEWLFHRRTTYSRTCWQTSYRTTSLFIACLRLTWRPSTSRGVQGSFWANIESAIGLGNCPASQSFGRMPTRWLTRCGLVAHLLHIPIARGV